MMPWRLNMTQTICRKSSLSCILRKHFQMLNVSRTLPKKEDVMFLKELTLITTPMQT